MAFPKTPIIERRYDRYYSWVNCPDTSDVYIIREVGGGPVKVGCAGRASSRINEMQVSNYRELEIVEAFCVPAKKMFIIEKAAHKRFAERRIRGEWFDIPDDVAKMGIALEVKAAGFRPMTRREFEAFSDEVTAKVQKLNQPIFERERAQAEGWL